MSERIIIMGAGMAGLCAAMALGGAGRDVIVLDRDPAPPDLGPDAAFESWTRRGVTQLRHSHVFLGRLVSLLRARQPELFQALEHAGAREFRLADSAPTALRDDYAYAPGDEDLSFLFSRRSTLELIMRRHAAHAAGASFITDAFVNGLIFEKQDGRVRVVGVRGVQNGEACEWRGDAVVDATGRMTQAPDWLAAEGIDIPQEESPAGILYFTRHYRLHDGAEEPGRGGAPGAGDLGYIKYGVFAADNRHFSITLACPEIEEEMRVALPRPDVFDAVCARLPGAAVWTDPARAAPASRVFAMGALKNAWRSYLDGGVPRVLGFYPIGDALIRTNPLYGRGCTTGAIQAFNLGDVFAATSDPAERLVALDRLAQAQIRPFFDAMVRQDKAAIRRAQEERRPSGRKPRLRARITQSFIDDAVGPASRGDMVVMRALMRPFHMQENPTAWLSRPDVMLRVFRMWATAKPLKAPFYPPPLGPPRAEMLQALGL